MKFGKQILAQQISGWGAYYLDYKFLKKIINSLEKGRLADAALFATGVRPPSNPSELSSSTDPLRPNSSSTSLSIDPLSNSNTTDSQAQELAHVHGNGPMDLVSSKDTSGTDGNGLNLNRMAGRRETLGMEIEGKSGKKDRNAEELQAHKAAFFFKLERELEKINAFYLQKESDLKLRLRVLISKRQTLFSRRLKPTSSHSSNYSSSLVPSKDSPSFIALHEGFKYFEKDLSKLQNFVEINATGFRKILKKWDKRSKSQTKEIFLTRQVEVQPCFNREFIAELSDVVAANLQELENIGEEEVNSTGKRNVNGSSKGNSTIEKMDGLEEDQQSMNELGMNTTSTTPMLNAGMKIGNGEEEYDALNDLEQALRDSIKNSRTEKARELIRVAKESLLSSETEEEDEGNVQGHFKSSSTLSDANHSSQAQTHVSRLVWRALLESSPNAIQNAISNHLVDFNFLDDINYRTCLHEASRAGNLQLVKLCVENGVEIRKKDAYGREAISYAAMMGHDEVCGYLLEVANGSNGKKDDRMDQDLDMDGFSPLVLAVINGRSKVVKILLDHGVLVEVPNPSIKLGGGTSQQRSAFPSVTSPSTFSSDLNPLCLASEGGHLDIVSLLIQRGATIQQNPEGLTPQALAARSGHHEILQLLLKNGSNSNVVEKGSKWTPIFFAAENGWTECIKVLLQNGADPNKLDEKNRKAEFYAAWNGKIDCLKILKEAEEEIETKGLNKVSSSSDDSSSTKSEKKKKKEKVGTDGDVEMEDLDLDLEIDGIPSLSLPPPIIPFRTYGHNYLDKRALVSVSLTNNSIKLYKHQDPNVPEPFSANSIKLVMTAKPDSSPRTAASSSTPSSKLSLPHSLNILFPLSDDSEVFSFQVDSLSKFSIQWELMSTFGSKVIGKAVALPSSFEGMTDRKRFVLPLQDSFLKLVGEISFEIDFVKPFDSVILEIGGKVETYWKSLLPSRENVTTSNSTRMTPLGASSDSSILAPKNLTNQVSPQTVSLPPIPPIATTASSTAPAPSLVTASSLSGSYLRITVQVTKDGIPVVFPHLGLPVPTPPGLNLNLDVYVGNVTATQFLGFAEATGKTVRKDKLQNLEGDEEEALGKWRDELDGRMITLENLLEILPVPIGIDLHLLYPSSADVRGNPSLPKLEVNHFVDTILHKVYAAGTLSPQQSRKILFSSRSPTVCTALNWKQPNYAVFFASYCALAHTAIGDSILAPCDRNEPDPRRRSVSEAVRFAKSNNLLGIMVDALLLNQVPQLVPSVKAAGLLLISIGTYSPTSTPETPIASISEMNETPADELVDGSVQNSIVRC